jgi:hypothetical protein
MHGDRIVSYSTSDLRVWSGGRSRPHPEDANYVAVVGLPGGRLLLSDLFSGGRILDPDGTEVTLDSTPLKAVAGRDGLAVAAEHQGVVLYDPSGERRGSLPDTGHEAPSCLALYDLEHAAWNDLPEFEVHVWTGGDEGRKLGHHAWSCAFVDETHLIIGLHGLKRIDLTTGEVTHTAELPWASSLFVAGGVVWGRSKESTTIYRFDAANLAPLQPVKRFKVGVVLGPGPDGHVLAGTSRGEVWELW